MADIELSTFSGRLPRELFECLRELLFAFVGLSARFALLRPTVVVLGYVPPSNRVIFKIHSHW